MSRNLIKSNGFTLVELSIVIIIIGFLIAGVSAGSALIQNSKLSSTVTTVQQLQQSISTFKARYDYLPGDIPNASSYFPSAHCQAGDTNINQDLCDGNGNGNGIYDVESGPGAIGSGDAVAEGIMGLQHMQDAGILTSGGTYRGGHFNSQGIGGAFMLIGENAVPSALHPNTGFQLESGNIFLSGPFYGYTGNVIFFSGVYTNGQPGAGAVTQEEAQVIDTKIDDGYPSTGDALSYSGHPDSGPGPCTTTAGGLLIYDVSQSNIVCTMGFKINASGE